MCCIPSNHFPGSKRAVPLSQVAKCAFQGKLLVNPWRKYLKGLQHGISECKTLPTIEQYQFKSKCVQDMKKHLEEKAVLWNHSPQTQLRIWRTLRPSIIFNNTLKYSKAVKYQIKSFYDYKQKIIVKIFPQYQTSCEW